MITWITLTILFSFGLSLAMSVIAPIIGCCDNTKQVYGKWLLRVSYGLIVFKIPQEKVSYICINTTEGCKNYSRIATDDSFCSAFKCYITSPSLNNSVSKETMFCLAALNETVRSNYNCEAWSLTPSTCVSCFNCKLF